MARSGTKAFFQVAVVSLFIRAILIVYGEWQDRFLEVKYTDVDYWVYSDAAAALYAGQSPYTRHTYRYTPLLALLLVPNSLLGGAWGKCLFAAFDVVAGYFIFRFLTRVTNPTRAAYITAALWLLNVMTFTISTRGNAESLLCTLILASLYFLTSGRHFLAGILYGAAIHLKIFPIIYSVAILAFLVGGKTRRSIDSSPPLSPKASNPSPVPSPSASPADSPNTKARRRRARELASQRPSALATPQKATAVPVVSSRRRIGNLLVFFVASVLSFVVLTGICYWQYRSQYLQEALLYHLARKDHRHNFSPYFYLFYSEAVMPLPKNFELFVFLPQAIFLVAAGLKFGKRDLPFACFISTHAFVTFNKVITSQYFIWYLCLLPMAFVSLHNISTRRWVAIALAWFGSQALWLNVAYKLEFLGENTFVPIWAASILFLLANVWISAQFIRHRNVPEILHAGPGIITLNSAVL